MENVRVGVIGMGNMGSQYAGMLEKGEIPGMELTAVTRVKREPPKGVPVFHTAEELLEYDNLDAVIIATPHYLHEEQAIRAMKRGLHVMCEKPAGVYALQAERMNAEAEKQGIVFGIMFQFRANPLYQKLRELVNSGTYGPLRRVNWILTSWYRTEDYYRSAPWRATWKTEGGGVLLNQAPHNLDLLQWICGMPCRIQAHCQEGRWHHIEVEDEVTAYMEFPNGATGVLVASTGDYPGVDRLQIDLEKAQIICEDGKLYIRSSEDKKTKQTMELCPEKCEKPYHRMLENFRDAIREGKPLIAEGTEGLKSLRISNAMYFSSWKNQMVDVPVDGEAFWRELQGKISQSQEH
ncbi:MAG: Gfo/Idh/MocA family oxidoreductase [Eubacteriales bacterium]|nr:Gfo/Idh/MocA family oxidoreductase [Eubacteriales bacterium]